MDTHLSTALQLAQLLKAARKRRRFTQAAVAARIGLSQNRLSYLELHPEEISVKQLMAWCATVGLELRIADRDDAAKAQSEAEW